jgi:hypothetical protein
MKFVDHLNLNPVCLNGDTDKFDFDASPLIENATVFDISEIAAQMIESHVDLGLEGISTTFTEVGKEWLPFDKSTSSPDKGRFVGIIPPFESCWFEYPSRLVGTPAGLPVEVDVAVHLWALRPEEVAMQCGDGYKFAMLATVFHRHIYKGVSISTRSSTGQIASGDEGQLLLLSARSCVPKGEDRTLSRNQPHITPILITLISLMLMNRQIVKTTLSPEVVKSRQQRRYEERHPSRATPPLFRFHTLSLDTNRVQHDGNRGTGGWETAWHVVRGFLRHCKSGKLVTVRPHSRGNPLKGVILKDYAVKRLSSKVA